MTSPATLSLGRCRLSWALFVLIALVCLGSASPSRADASRKSDYDGLQLAPTLHLGSGRHDAHGGVGIDLSLNRWFGTEAWLTRVFTPRDGEGVSRAWSTGVAALGRIGGLAHRFVYSAGLSYTNRYDCDGPCSLSTFYLEEPEAVTDMFAAQVRLGYEARTSKRWFVRTLLAYEFPFAGAVWNLTEETPIRWHEPPATFNHGFIEVTVGYLFQVR